MKQTILLAIESSVLEEAKKRFPRALSKKFEDFLRKELNIQNNECDEEAAKMQELIDLKREICELAKVEGGELAIRIAAKNTPYKTGTVSEKLTFWQEVKKKARQTLLKYKAGVN